MSIIQEQKHLTYASDSEFCFRMPKNFLKIENFALDNRFRFKLLNQGRYKEGGVVDCNLPYLEKGELWLEPPLFWFSGGKINQPFRITRTYGRATHRNDVSLLITLL